MCIFWAFYWGSLLTMSSRHDISQSSSLAPQRYFKSMAQHLTNYALRFVNWGVLLMLIPYLSVSFQLHQNEIHTGVLIHVTSIEEHVYRELLCQKLAWAVPVKDGRSDNSKGLSRLTVLSLPLHTYHYFCLH